MSHIETTFSFRTRILDYLWAGLPMVVTEGDSFADLIKTEGLGVVVPAQDVDALAVALDRVLYDEAFIAECAVNLARVRQDFYWKRTLAPLVNFVANPQHAADHAATRRRGIAIGGRVRKPYGLRHDLRMAWHHLRHTGVRATLGKVFARLGR
jgi:hypothetical protein